MPPPLIPVWLAFVGRWRWQVEPVIEHQNPFLVPKIIMQQKTKFPNNPPNSPISYNPTSALALLVYFLRGGPLVVLETDTQIRKHTSFSIEPKEKIKASMKERYTIVTSTNNLTKYYGPHWPGGHMVFCVP